MLKIHHKSNIMFSRIFFFLTKRDLLPQTPLAMIFTQFLNKISTLVYIILIFLKKIDVSWFLMSKKIEFKLKLENSYMVWNTEGSL